MPPGWKRLIWPEVNWQQVIWDILNRYLYNCLCIPTYYANRLVKIDLAGSEQAARNQGHLKPLGI